MSSASSRGWRRVDRQAEAREIELRHANRKLYVYPDVDGTVVVRGRLTPEAGALLMQALAAARDAQQAKVAAQPADVPAETPSMAQQQADALVLIAETALQHGIDPGTPGARYQVVSTSMPMCWPTRRRQASP